jgi:hypothetical protein
LVNSFGARDGAEPVDHRGDGSRGATNDALCRACTDRATFERRPPNSERFTADERVSVGEVTTS